jgi:hypothetical protein
LCAIENLFFSLFLPLKVMQIVFNDNQNLINDDNSQVSFIVDDSVISLISLLHPLSDGQ